MRRREFIAALVGAATMPPAANAQQPRLAAVAVLALGNPPPAPFMNGLREALRAADYVEGRNIALQLRSAAGRSDRLPELAAELVRSKVDVIVAYLTPAATAAKQATGDIPVVMAGVGDPVGTGLVASLARPGGNVTGTTTGSAEVAGKLVELIRELLPTAQRFAVLANETDPFTVPFLREIERVARSVGLELYPEMVHPAVPLANAFQSMSAKRAEAVIIQGSLVRQAAIDLAMKHRLPLLSAQATVPRWGGLMSYSAGSYFRETAAYIDKLLKGAKPADLPVSFPSRFELIVNLKSAKLLGLTIAPTMIARADEVIE
jgi:putative ABC transport system substrate-binding protein